MQQALDRAGNGNDDVGLRPSTFNGLPSENVSTWLAQVRRLGAANHWTDERRVGVVKACLRGSAASWFERLPQADKDNVNDFEGNLRRAFAPTLETTLLARQQLRNRAQGMHEPVAAYADALAAICDNIDEISEADKLDMFVANLQPSLRPHVRRAAPRTLADAIHAAKVNEVINKESESHSTVAAVVSRTSAIEDTVQRMADTMRSVSEALLDLQQQQQRQHQREQQQQQRQPVQRQNQRCYNCGRTGHFVRDCRAASSPRLRQPQQGFQ